MFPDLSLFVTKEKYRQKKAQIEHLTNQNQQLAQELAESNRQFREVEKELKQLLDIFSTFDITKEEGERLLRKAKNYVQKIQILEERVKGLLWLVQQLNQQNQTKNNEINELYANEIGWEIEKTLREKDLTRLKTTNQNWQASYQIAQAKLNQITEREEELLETSHEKLTFLTSQLTNLTLSLNYIKWERDSWQAKFSQLESEKNKLSQNLQAQINQTNQVQQELDQQKQRTADLETENEQRNNYRSQRSQRNPQWRNSEATLFGIEEDENQPENSNNAKNVPQIQNNSNWKSALWQKTKKLGLTALAAYGSYQTGYHQGTNSNPLTNQNLTQFNNFSLNPTQLYNHHYQPVSYNQTHSWVENPFFKQQFHTHTHTHTKSPHESSLLKELEQLRLRPNITRAEYEQLKTNQAPANLPLDWESKLVRIKDLECRPTQEQLDKAVQQEKAKHQHLVDPVTYRADWINPAELETKAQQKGMVSQKTYNQRPNLTIAKYNELLKNQKPLDLPPNWKSQLARIPELEKRPNVSQEKFSHYKSPDQVAEIEKSVRQAEANKYKGFINPVNPTALNEHKLFTEDQAKKAIEDNNKDWTNKGLINPLNQTEIEQAGLVPKTKLEQAIQERDNRPNLTLTEWQNELNTLTCQDTLLQNDLIQTKKDLTLAQHNIQNLEQEKTQALANVENLNQQLDDAQQELVRTQRKNRKLTKKLNQQKAQQAKTQQQAQKQSSYLLDIFNCLTSVGVGAKLGWKAGRAYERGELQIKYLKDIQNGVDVLIQQKKKAQQNQQKAEQERDHYRQQFENHRCSSANFDQPASQTQVKIIQQTNEQAIIQELNTTLHLNLNNPTLNQVISEIQSRIAKDPVVVEKGLGQVWQTIQKAEEKLVDQTPFGEDLETIKELEIKGLNELFPQQLEESFIREIKQVQNYSQLVQVRNSFLAKHLAQVQKAEIKELKPAEINPANLVVKQSTYERYIWISLLAVSLVSMGGLLMKLKGIKRVK